MSIALSSVDSQEGVLRYSGAYVSIVQRTFFHRILIVILLGVPLFFTVASATTYYYPLCLHFLEENLGY